MVKSRSAVAVLSLCVIAAGVWMTWRTQRPSTSAPTSADVLAAIPQAAGDSPTDQAITKWTRLAKLRPHDDNAWVQLGDALMQKARETADAGYYTRAESVFQQALSVQPQNVEALTGLAWVSGARHEFEVSIAWAQKALALDPQHHAAYGLLGDAAVEIGQYEQAFAHYQQMQDIRPDLASYSRGAHFLFLTGDTRKALWLMQKAIAAGAPYAENTAWCRAQLALMLWNTGALLPAQQTLQAALKQTPHNYHLLTVMGKVKTAQKEYPAAVEFYQQAIAIAPQHEVVVALGDLFLLMGEKEEAEKQYTLVETIYTLTTANGVRDDIHMARFFADHDRNVAEALRQAEAVYRTRPNVFVADTLAWCYYKNGRYEEARKTIQHALKHRTPDAMIFFHAGMIYAKVGDKRSAQQYLYKALNLNPHFHPFSSAVAAETLQQLGGQ